jgi:hypothetical protein
MFDHFKSHFILDADPTGLLASESRVIVSDPRLNELLEQFSGASFNKGLYRIVASTSFHLAKGFIAIAVPSFAIRAVPFGYDWLGRIFALDPARIEGGSPSVVMFEPGTGEVLQMPCNLLTFHETELIDYCEEALAANFHRQWLQSGGPAPKQSQCIGYKRPLYLGGRDEIENLEMSNLDVYWTITGQLLQKARGLPAGARIDNVKLRD